MSVDRRDSRDEEALIKRQLEARQAEDARQRGQHRAEASAESIDRFKAALQRQGEPKPPPQQSPDTYASSRQGVLQRHGQANVPARTADQVRQAAEQAAAHDGGQIAEQAGARELKEYETRRKQGAGDDASGDSSGGELSGMWQAQMALRDAAATAQATPAAPVNTQVFSELIQRHVRQMAASDSAGQQGEGQVLLRMSDATLPGTDLLLSRTATGWMLRADSRSRESFEAIRRAAPELARRFADNDLGELIVDPHFHG